MNIFAKAALFSAAALGLAACQSTNISDMRQAQPIVCETKPIMEQKAAPSSGTLLVYYENRSDCAPLKDIAEGYGATVLYAYNHFNILALAVPAGKTLEEAEQYFSRQQGVVQVSRDRKLKLM